jgi:photosystem II stability/assembly factor-like uncharacterized protein
MRPILLALGILAALATPARAAQTAFPEDATLRAVQFLDADVGWAAGDEGVIWKTVDGGNSWTQQNTGVRGSLRSIHMLSASTGWVVGRDEMPGGMGSTGIVLCTRDGGQSWQRILKDRVPGLNHIRFADANNAYFAGDGSEQFPTGGFLTKDGGQNWQPLAGSRCTSWLGGDFLNPQAGSLVGSWGCFGVLHDGEFSKAEVDSLGGRNVKAVALRPAGAHSLAVGQGALILRSKNFGVKWDFTSTNLPQELMANWDFHAVACVGNKVWIAGRPGSAVLSSGDQGETWTISKTSQALPIHGLHFFGEQHGWAVGELGTILATTDGGKSWAVQRAGGRRAAALFVHARAQDVPVDALAQLGAEQGWLTVALRLAGPDPRSESAADAAQPQRLAAACRIAGAATAEQLWQFSLPAPVAGGDKAAVITHWDRMHNTKAAQQIMRQLVLAIRMWRPNSVVTDSPDEKQNGNAAGAVVAEALQAACKLATDASAFPEQIEQLGLEPWKVARVWCLWEKGATADLWFDNSQESLRLDGTMVEFAEKAASILGRNGVPTTRAYRLLASPEPTTGKESGLLEGVGSGTAGPCRRSMPPLGEPDHKRIAALRAQRQLVGLAANTTGLTDPAQLLAQVPQMLAKLPQNRAADSVFALANAFARQGQWDLARETYLQLVLHYPAHPSTIDACRWLIRYNCSSEARRRSELGQFLLVGQKWEQDSSAMVFDPAKVEGRQLQIDATKDTVSPVKARHSETVTFLGNPSQLRSWFEGSLQLGKHLAELGPIYGNDPSVQFCLQAARRKLGNFKEANEFYAAYCSDHVDGAWREAASQELWAAQRRGLPPRPVLISRATETKPYLDGTFDDACWAAQKPVALQNAVSDTTKEYATQVAFAHDAKYLYIALDCKHPRGHQVPAIKERQRDADLNGFDRVSIMLDLDRDYSTYFQFHVDQRGCVREDCWGDKNWNPQWFVAIQNQEDSWRAEIAIPLRELTGDRIVDGTAWACNVVRNLPGRGVQALSTPAGVEPRAEGMTLLIFTQPPRTPATAPQSKENAGKR